MGLYSAVVRTWCDVYVFAFVGEYYDVISKAKRLSTSSRNTVNLTGLCAGNIHHDRIRIEPCRVFHLVWWGETQPHPSADSGGQQASTA